MKLLSLFCAYFLLQLSVGIAQEASPQKFLGAQAVIEQVQAAQAQLDTEQEDLSEDDFSQQIASFTDLLPNLSHEAAVTQWLKLVDTLPDTEQSDESRQLQKLIEVIPGPDSWPTLLKAIEARPNTQGAAAVREQILSMVAHVLVSDAAAQQADLEAIETSLADLPETGADYLLRDLAMALVNTNIDPQLATALITYRIESQLKSANAYDDHSLEIPDLVTLVGPENAKQLLRKALASPLTLEIEIGDETKLLARTLALEMIDQLPVAQWGLCNSIEATDLYEALEKRFLNTEPQSSDLSSEAAKVGKFLSRLAGIDEDEYDPAAEDLKLAKVYYFLGLIVKGRTAEATQFSSQVFTRLVKQQPAKPQIHYLIGYLRESQHQYPEALEAFQQAVTLDPDYLNAWKNILDIHNHMYLPREIRDQAIFNALRLDPLGKQFYCPVGQATDLAQLWKVFTEHRPQKIDIPESIYRLKASSKKLEEQELALKKANLSGINSYNEYYYGTSSWDDGSKSDTPGELIARNDIISSLCELFDQLRYTE